MTDRRHALVLGGYGLIGRSCMAALDRAGFAVTGLGRSEAAARATAPDADWKIHDITRLSVEAWTERLDGVDVVVNAAGVLQDGAQDNLRAIHVEAVERLAEALKAFPACRLVQISAAGVAPTASTYFMRSKAQGDTIVASEAPDWVILRPVLVLSPEAYGGTALLRAASGLPGVLPRVFPEALVQTVHVDDVAAAVVRAAEGRVPSFTIADLTEGSGQGFETLMEAVRRWQGLPPPRWRPAPPDWMIGLVARGADLLGHLGWRSPLRSTALDALQDGIAGDATTWAEAGGPPCRSLRDSLASLPATRQERLFARVFLGLPVAIGVLALFWTLSGLIAFAAPRLAMEELIGRGVTAWLAAPLVLFGAAADVALGLGILVRRFARPAAIGMVLLSLVYLLGSVIVAPDLWADPMGPMLKVLPGMALAFLVWLMLEPR